MTSFQSLYGHEPPTVARYILGSAANELVESYLLQRDERDHKLGRRYIGPYQVLKRVGSIAYRVELLESARIHSVFYISMLKRCVGTPDQQVTPLQLGDSNASDGPIDSNLEDKVVFQGGSNVVNENRVDWVATQNENVGLSRRTSRKVIPPKRLAGYVWKDGSSREEG
nr:uncharacterized protein LOC117275025 [Nicotiana tomentosiformis]